MRLTPAWAYLGAVLVTLAGIGPAVAVILLLRSQDAGSGRDERVQYAQAGIANICKAVEAFKLRHGFPPDTLQQLTLPDAEEGTPPLLQPRDLIDPWGRPYVYDPRDVHPTNGRPLIRSLGPNGDGVPEINTWK